MPDTDDDVPVTRADDDPVDVATTDERRAGGAHRLPRAGDLRDRGEVYDDDEFDDDDYWDYEGSRSRRGGGPAWLIPAIAVVVLGIVLAIVLIAKGPRDNGEKGAKAGDQQGEQTTDVPAGSATTIGTATSAPTAPVQSWPPEVVGRPSEVANGPSTSAAPGVYIWTDYSGWHLRRVSGPQVSAISGTVTSTDNMQGGTLIGIPGGTVKVSQKTLLFDLPDGGKHVSGFDFYQGFYGSTLTFDIRDAQRPLPASLIHTGPSALAVISNPVAFNKR